jgi:hypothetical protein
VRAEARAVFGAALAVALVASCMGPTEISIDVTSNACAALGQVDIYVGHPDATFVAPSTSTSKGCAAGGNSVGTLTVVPSGGIGDHVELVVVGSVGGVCDGPATTDARCIVARRSLAFVPHRALPLPVFLDVRCAGHVCPDHTTCAVVSGTPACVDATCDSDGGIVCSGDAGAPDAAACLEPAPDSGTPKLEWSFDDRNDQMLHEDKDRVAPQPLLDGYFASNSAPCGSFFNTLAQDQPLAIDEPALVSPTFTVAFEFNAINDAVLLQYVPTNAQGGGYVISNLGGNLVVESNVGTPLATDTVNTADGGWHTFAMIAGSNGSSFVRDGQIFGSVSGAWIPVTGTLSVGARTSIDQIQYFTP